MIHSRFENLFWTNADKSLIGGHSTVNSYVKEKLEKLVELLPDDAEVVSVTTTQAGQYGQYFSINILYKVYDD